MVAVSADRVPPETGLTRQSFRVSGKGRPYTAPGREEGIWRQPDPKAGPFTAVLSDGSSVTYAWYRFVDQPSVRALGWSEAEQKEVQSLVERLHVQWAVASEYLPAPSRGKLVELDGALRVVPPEGFEVGYVPIVLGQTAAP